MYKNSTILWTITAKMTSPVQDISLERILHLTGLSGSSGRSRVFFLCFICMPSLCSVEAYFCHGIKNKDFKFTILSFKSELWDINKKKVRIKACEFPPWNTKNEKTLCNNSFFPLTKLKITSLYHNLQIFSL